MDELSIWRLKALRLPVGLVLLAAWLFVFFTFNPTSEMSGSIWEPDTIERTFDYTNMLICGVFGCAMGFVFLLIVYLPSIRSLAIEPSRSELFSARLFKLIGFSLLIIGVGWIFFAITEPF